jgi:hypothetical protein
MSHITQKQIDHILNSTLPSPAALLKSAICARCGNLRALEKYCTYCAKRRAIQTKERRQLELLGIVHKSDMDDAYERLFEGRKIKPAQMQRLRYRTLLILVHELARVLELSPHGIVAISPHNQPRTIQLVKVLNRLNRGWAKPETKKYRHKEEVRELVGGEFGLTRA